MSLKKHFFSTVCAFANVSLDCNMPKLYDKCCQYLTRSMKKTKPVYDLDKLNDQIAVKIFKNAFRQYRCSPEEDDCDSNGLKKNLVTALMKIWNSGAKGESR